MNKLLQVQMNFCAKMEAENMESEEDLNEELQNYANLPMEIIISIFRYLSFMDLQAASLTCRRWQEASLYSEFTQRNCIKFVRTYVNDKTPPCLEFLRSKQRYAHLHLEDVTMGQASQFVQHLSGSLYSLSLQNVEMNDKHLSELLRPLKNLRALQISSCTTLFMVGNYSKPLVEAVDLTHLRSLSLCHNQYLSDAILLYLTQTCTALETLSLCGCPISYHGIVQYRFYGNTPLEEREASEAILTFQYVKHVLQRHRHSLRELNLSETLIGTSAIMELCALEGMPQLHSLNLRACRQLNSTYLNALLLTQPQLRELDLSETRCVTNSIIETLTNSVPLLESLNLRRCEKLTDDGAILLGKLRYLRRLNLSYCDKLNSRGILEGIAREPNSVLQELRLAALNLCVACVKRVAENLPQLRVLDVSKCSNSITDESLQCILEKLCWLRELHLEDCFRLTDGALIGLLVNTPDSRFQDYDELPNTAADGSVIPNISLRSRAEQEIVRDAIRKKTMLAFYEFTMSEDNQGVQQLNTKGFSIQRLRGLQTLNLSGCQKISDISLKHGLKFLELRRLLLSNLQQVTLSGLEALVQNSPSIEELDLSDCFNINDKAVDVISRKLTRLRELHLNGCTQLTEASVGAIATNCKRLQTISLNRCRNLYNIEERLFNMPTLRNFRVDNMNIENAQVLRQKKRRNY